ncbi:MAG: T9SS type A sorting domain-containing protein [Bacteroidota bacterium]
MLFTRLTRRASTVAQSRLHRIAGLPIALALFVLAASGAVLAQEIDHRPVVLTGADVPALTGADVTTPVCFTFVDGAWAQCPLQIDERAMLDPASNYPTSISDAAELFGGTPQLLYTAPQDYPMNGFTPIIQVDPDPTFDADDELVLMARFFGDVVSPQAPPFAPEEVVEVLFEGRAAYVFVPTSPLAQDAGYDLVSYSFDLLSGDFPSTYNFEGDTTLPDEWGQGDFLAANPEYSAVQTDYYQTAFEDRWIQREWSMTDGQGGYGPDILDRVKFGTRPNTMGNQNNCGRSIWTGSARRGTLGIQKDGPIRALRYAQGFNSGGLNYVLYTMYERYIVYYMAHQMHRTPGASMWFDLSTNAYGMQHRSNLFAGTVSVDGTPDRTGNGFVNAYLEWDHFAGSQGSFVSVWEVDTNIPGAFPHSYYEDDTTPQVQQCTGDDVATASSGNVYIFGNNVQDAFVPWTDPSNGASFDDDDNLRLLRLTRRVIPDGPNMPSTQADSLVTSLQAPITFTAQNVAVIGDDVQAPLFSGTYDGLSYEGTTSDSRIGDSGLDSLVLGGTSANLSFTADAFTPGDPSAGFAVAPINVYAPSSGFVVAADTAGNVDSLAVSFTALIPDETAPVLTGTYSRSRFDGTATDDHIDAAGLASVTLSADAINLDLAVDPFNDGDSPIAFVATPIDDLLLASGFVIATDTVGNSDSLFVEITPPDPDTAPPALTGTLNGFSFDGHATERAADDTGIASIALSADATNLDLAVDTFTAGADSVGFVAMSVDADLAGTGYVIATDMAGNADSLAVTIAARPPDVTAPVISGAFDDMSFDGLATEIAADDQGISTVALAADATNLDLSVDLFTVGTDSVSFVATSVDPDFQGLGYVIATDVMGNADSLLVDIAPRPDTTAPIVGGSLDASTFAGSATDRQPDDRGLSTIALDAGAANLELSVDTFEAGTDSVGFSATAVDAGQDATGWVIATDVVGNADSVFVEIPALPAFDLTLTIEYAYTNATNGTITVTAINAGTEPMSNVRVSRLSFTDVTVEQKQLSAGALGPGDSTDVVFTFTGAGPDASSFFRIRDLHFRVGDEFNSKNNVAEAILINGGSARIAGATDGESDALDASDEADLRADEGRGDEGRPQPGEMDSETDAAPERDAPAAEGLTEATPDGRPGKPTDSARPETDAPQGAADSKPSGKPELATDASDEPSESQQASSADEASATLASATLNEEVEASGTSGAIHVASVALPETLSMRLYPNPGRAYRTVDLALPEQTRVRMTLTDLLGRQVRTWSQDFEAGYHGVALDLGTVAAGPYVLNVTAGDQHAVVRLTVLP